MSQGLVHRNCGDTHGEENSDTGIYQFHKRDLLEKKYERQVM
jgi:hypothetical protein